MPKEPTLGSSYIVYVFHNYRGVSLDFLPTNTKLKLVNTFIILFELISCMYVLSEKYNIRKPNTYKYANVGRINIYTTCKFPRAAIYTTYNK